MATTFFPLIYLLMRIYSSKKLFPASGGNPRAKPSCVPAESSLFLKALGQAIQQHLVGLGAGGSQPVVHPLSFLASDDKPNPPQVSQMSGNGRLRTIQHGNDVANAYLAPSEQIQNPQPSSVGDRSKNFCDLVMYRLGSHIRLSKYTNPAQACQGDRKKNGVRLG